MEERGFKFWQHYRDLEAGQKKYGIGYVLKGLPSIESDSESVIKGSDSLKKATRATQALLRTKHLFISLTRHFNLLYLYLCPICSFIFLLTLCEI